MLTLAILKQKHYEIIVITLRKMYMGNKTATNLFCKYSQGNLWFTFKEICSFLNLFSFQHQLTLNTTCSFRETDNSICLYLDSIWSQNHD